MTQSRNPAGVPTGGQFATTARAQATDVDLDIPAANEPVFRSPVQDGWTPRYEPWRHGGWYVMNVQYPNGAVGCVSRNYTDRKWRIATADAYPGSPTDRTFPIRDAAAQAERELVAEKFAAVRADINYSRYRAAADALPADIRDDLGSFAHTDVTLRVACRDARDAGRRAASTSEGS